MGISEQKLRRQNEPPESWQNQLIPSPQVDEFRYFRHVVARINI